MRKFVTIISLIACCFSSFASSFIAITADGSKDEFEIGKVQSIKFEAPNKDAKGYRTIVFNPDWTKTESVSSTMAIMAYPNPVSDYIYISGIEDSEEVILRNMEGAVVSRSNGSKVDVSFLPMGNYILTVRNQSVKFIKK